MDPPEVHVTITAPCGVPSGPAFPTPTIKTTCRGGPIAVAFGFHRPCRSEGRRLPSKLTSGILQQSRVSANDKPTLAGRLARRQASFKALMICFPQRTARREAREQSLNLRLRATNKIRALAGPATEYGCAVFYRRPGGRRQKSARKKTGS